MYNTNTIPQIFNIYSIILNNKNLDKNKKNKILTLLHQIFQKLGIVFQKSDTFNLININHTS